MRGIVISLFSLLFCWGLLTSPARAQKKSQSLLTPGTNEPDSLKYKAQRWSVELDLMLNPIYISQFSTHYRLNGQPLGTGTLPRFYAVQPGQLPLSNLSEILDQSNAIYVYLRLDRFNRFRYKFWHDMRLVVGLTHDKLQTGSDSVYYKYNDGGTELSVLLNKQLASRLSDLDFKAAGLIFSFNVQAGLFLSLAQINTHLVVAGDTIKSSDSHRFIWSEPKPYIGGWGWLVASNMEIGGAINRHFAITVAAKVMGEGLYSSADVQRNGIGGYRLRVNNYGIFFAGPVLNLKILNL